MSCSNCGVKLKENSRFCDRCAHQVMDTSKYENSTEELSPLTELTLSYVAMRKHFRFTLRESKGVILFSYNYLVKGHGYIKEEGILVDQVYMQELRDFVQNNGYMHLQNATPSSRIFPKPLINDEPSCHLIIKCKSKEVLSLSSRTLPPNGDKLKEFFIKIAEDTQQ